MHLRSLPRLLFFIMVSILLLGASSVPPGDATEQVRAYTRGIEFDFVAWTLDAVGVKIGQSAAGLISYLSDETQHRLTLEYIQLVDQIQQQEGKLYEIYADPSVTDPVATSKDVRLELDRMYTHRAQIGPLAESILQAQVSAVASSLGLTLGGQPLPPVLFHSTPIPSALIVSPRNVIRQDQDISLVPGLTLEQIIALEDQVDRSQDVSSLVVGIGGIGVYPTMVMQTSDLNWLTETVSHEWVHNFLTLRPLGVSYENSPELRTMNETTASIAGKEIGRALIERYYPELLPPPPQPAPPPSSSPSKPAEPPAFSFNAEMHLTRLTVDKFLAEGKIDEAEAYMKQRRTFLWDHGYHIRKLNQAYFAFYGAYADQPGGAAGVDPVGAAVRALRSQSPTLAAVLNRISWMSTFQQLQQAVK
jgi:hypothetical protein